MDPEVVEKKFFALLRKISKGKVPPQDLLTYMQSVEIFCNEEGIELVEFLEEVFPDVICEEAHEIINNSEWRSDSIGKKCITDPETLKALFPILTRIDQNTELIFASNPHTPLEILEELSHSTYDWEEDGTSSTLARNTNNEALLRVLAMSPDPSTRFSVAGNRFCPTDVLMSLSSDDQFSRHLLFMTFSGGMSPSATDPAEEMAKCSVKYALIHNPATPLEVVSQVATNQMNFDASSNPELLGVHGINVNTLIRREAEKVLITRA